MPSFYYYCMGILALMALAPIYTRLYSGLSLIVANLVVFTIAIGATSGIYHLSKNPIEEISLSHSLSKWFSLSHEMANDTSDAAFFVIGIIAMSSIRWLILHTWTSLYIDIELKSDNGTPKIYISSKGSELHEVKIFLDLHKDIEVIEDKMHKTFYIEPISIKYEFGHMAPSSLSTRASKGTTTVYKLPVASDEKKGFNVDDIENYSIDITLLARPDAHSHVCTKHKSYSPKGVKIALGRLS